MEKQQRGLSLSEKFGKAAAGNSGRVHVVPSGGRWAVKKEGAKRATVVTSSIESALRAAASLKFTAQVILHKKDGTVQVN